MLKISDLVRERVLKDDGYGQGEPIELFHPSSAGYCARQIFLNKLGVKVFPEEIRGAMQSGTILHEWIQSFPEVKEDFHIEQVHVLEIPDTKLYFQGKIDLKNKKNDFVIDIKSIKDLYYVKFEPMPAHVFQINIYMAMAKSTMGELFYIQKNDLQTKSHFLKFDKKLLSETFEKIKLVYEALRIFDNGKNMVIPFDKCDCYACRNEKLHPKFEKLLQYG